MSSNGISKAEIAKRAIPLNRKAQTSRRGLRQLRQALQGNQLALDHLGGFLRYANELLTRAEQRKAHRLDVALAIVEYGNCEFWFIRPTGINQHKEVQA